MMPLTLLIKQILDGQGFPCLFHFITGLYCPGCGGTRAVRLLIRGEVARSIQYHPFIPFLAAVFLIEGFLYLAGWGKALLKKEKRQPYILGLRGRYRLWTVAGVALVMVNCLVKNVCLLMGIDLLLPL